MTALRNSVLTFVVFVLLSSLAHAGSWTTLDPPYSIATEAHGINGAGDVVGWYVTSGGVFHGFLLSGGNYTTLDVAGASDTTAYGINDSGQVVGDFQDRDLVQHGFLFDGRSYRVLDYPGAVTTGASGINNAGEVVGSYVDGSQVHGFRWSDGNFVTVDVPGALHTFLSGINKSGHIVGAYYDTPSHFNNFMLNPQGRVRTLAIKRAAISGVNDHKTVAGSVRQNGLRFNVRTKHPAEMRFPHSFSTGCFAINNSGQVVGKYLDQSGTSHGFLWRPR